MLPDRESLTVEFKSEQRRPQSDDEIVDNVVALANTQGGTLYLGIEDNGIVTGVSEQHSNINGLAAFIFNKTVPQQTTRIESFHEHGCQVVAIEVDNSQQIVSTSNGKTLQRRLKADGTPEVVPLFVSQFISRLSQQRSYDYSDMPAPGGELTDGYRSPEPIAPAHSRDQYKQFTADFRRYGLRQGSWTGVRQ